MKQTKYIAEQFQLPLGRRDFTDCISLVKPCNVGKVQIVHDTPSTIDRIRGQMDGQPLTKETYCRLLINNSTVMTDAEFERKTNIGIICEARGNALVAGLGIGLILQPLIDNCKQVTVIEKDPDVIKAVGPAFPKANIILGDIFEWLPPPKTKYDTIYFDIWADICRDDLEDAKILHKRFRKFLTKGGYMQSWTRIANLYNRW